MKQGYQNLRDDLVNDIAQAYRLELLEASWLINFGDQNKDCMEKTILSKARLGKPPGVILIRSGSLGAGQGIR